MKKNNRTIKPEIFVFDVDGVMTDGKFYYTEKGKVMKKFGPDDNDALSLLDPFMEIRFISGDKRGFSITKKRIGEDMKRPIDLVSTVKRIEWIEQQYDPKTVIYMGDGIFDSLVFRKVGYSIAPSNADVFLKQQADYVTNRKGGDRAVAEAVLHVLETFFVPFDRISIPLINKNKNEWG